MMCIIEKHIQNHSFTQHRTAITTITGPAALLAYVTHDDKHRHHQTQPTAATTPSNACQTALPVDRQMAGACAGRIHKIAMNGAAAESSAVPAPLLLAAKEIKFRSRYVT